MLISKSAMRYLLPVRGTIHALCVRPEEGRMASFRKKFAAKGRAQLRLSVTIVEEGKTAVVFEGKFVAVKGNGE